MAIKKTNTKNSKPLPLGENIAVRLPDDLIRIIDAEAERRSANEAGDPVTRSMVIRDSLRRQLISRGSAREKIEASVATAFDALPKCHCGQPATFMGIIREVGVDVLQKWWCLAHLPENGYVEVDFQIQLSVAMVGSKVVMPYIRPLRMWQISK